MPRKFTLEEDNLIKTLYPHYPPEVVASAINRTIPALYKRAWKLRVNAFRTSNGKPKKIAIDPFVFSQMIPEAAYWAGFIAADGNLVEDTWTISLLVADQDAEHLLDFASFIGFDGELYKYPPGPNNVQSTTSIAICGAPFVYLDLLFRYNITPKKSLMLQPPQGLPYDLEKAYLRGLFDGDGTCGIYDGKHRISIPVATSELAEWVWIVAGCGPCTMQPCGKIWDLQYVSEKALTFARTLLSVPVKGLNRKTETLRQILAASEQKAA